MVAEQEQLLASKIAYADLDEAFEHIPLSDDGSVSLTEAIKYAIEHEKALGDLYPKYVNNDGTFKSDFDFAKNWTITATINENTDAGSGLYACILDTGDANILACRGSESMGNLQNWRQDWYGADLKLLNSEMTSQEEALALFMKDNRDLLNGKPWVSTGHSLGGALADYAAIHSVELGMDNYSGTINFDGPGHSLEFIEKYEDKIAQVCNKMVHKKASVVGSILFDLPGISPEFIKTKVDGIFSKHSMENWDYENGCTVPGSQGDLPAFVEKLTRGTDRLPSYAGNGVVYIINLAVEGIFWAKGIISDHPELAERLLNNFCTYLISHPQVVVASVVVIAKIIACVAVALLVIALGEIIIEALESFIQSTVDYVCAQIKQFAENAATLFNAAMEWLNSTFENIRRNSPGGKYVGSHPQFSADTNLLREYANRLRTVNSRLASLDRALNDLYLQVGLLDIDDILRANLVIGHSWRISKCQTYLNTAADTLETADQQALVYLGG